MKQLRMGIQMRNSGKILFFLSLLIFLTSSVMGAAAASIFSPVDPEALFVQPNRKTVLRFAGESTGKESSVPYSILDYTGREISSGQLLRGKDGKFFAEFSFDRGFYEIMIPVSKQRFGVVSLKKYTKERDLFFGLQTDFFIGPLYANKNPDLADKLYRNFFQLGISSVREYHPWGWAAKTQEKHWTAWDRMYRSAKVPGLKVLSYFYPQEDFAFHPEGRKGPQRGKYFWDVDLNRMKPVLLHYLSRYENALLALQCANEPDIKSSPGNEYTAFLNACSWFLNESKTGLQLIGSGFAGESRPVHDSFYRNGMLDHIDVFAFQTYRDPVRLQNAIAEYRAKLKKYAPERAGMPVWITETSFPWSRGVLPKQMWGGDKGKLRADIAEDMKSACFLATTTAEAKSCGISAVFPFEVRANVEENRNYGLMDFRWTAHRQLAAYLHSAGILSGKKYIGDFVSKKPEMRQRVFSDGTETVVFISRIKTGAYRYDLSLLPGAEVFGVDGRKLQQDQSGAVNVPDGVIYAVLQKGAKIDHLINSRTAAMKLCEDAGSYKPTKRKISPVIYQSVLSGDTRKDVYGYHLDPEEISVNIYNLSDSVRKTHPELLLPADVKITGRNFRDGELELPPNSRQTITWKLDTSKSAARIRFTVKDRAADGAAPLVMDFIVPKKYAAVKAVPTDASAKWESNTNGKSTISHDAAEQAVKVETIFPETSKGSKWVYPIYTLKLSPQEVKKLIAVSFEIKAVSQNPYFTYVGGAVFDEKNTKEFWVAAPRSSEWQERFASIHPIEDPSGRLKIRLGMCCFSPRLTYWIRNVKLYFDK